MRPERPRCQHRNVTPLLFRRRFASAASRHPAAAGTRPAALFGCVLALGIAAAACGRTAAEPAPVDAEEPKAARPRDVADAAVAPFRRELLQVAFEAASKVPSTPHRKNRGRAQEEVLEACFAIGLPRLALQFAPQAEGWRRGLAYADVAYQSARQGATERFDDYLALAEAVVAAESAAPNFQRWRVDKVRQKISRALAACGRTEKALEVAAAIDSASRASVDANWTATVATRVQDTDAAQARRDLEAITESWENQSLGEQYTSLLVLSALHGRFFADATLREELEERVFLRYLKLPAGLRLDAMAPMVGHCLANEDLEGARAVIARMDALVAQTRWRTEDRLPQLARIAELRVDTGEPDRARAELEAALAVYQAERGQMFDIYRCEALRPVALGFHKLGDAEQFAGLLALAVEEGAENPNARPRCDDLVATCVVLAKRGIEPPAEVMARLREISEGLKEPW